MHAVAGLERVPCIGKVQFAGAGLDGPYFQRGVAVERGLGARLHLEVLKAAGKARHLGVGEQLDTRVGYGDRFRAQMWRARFKRR